MTKIITLSDDLSLPRNRNSPLFFPNTLTSNMLTRPFPRTKETLFSSISVLKPSTLIIPLTSILYSIAELQVSSSINSSLNSTTLPLVNSLNQYQSTTLMEPSTKVEQLKKQLI